MTRQFRKNSLLQAILGFISLSTATVVFAQSEVQIEQTPDSTDLYVQGQEFFEQYYLSPQELAATSKQQVKPSNLCRGTWVTPLSDNVEASSNVNEITSVINADKAYYNPAGTSYLEGNVTIDQPGRQIRADKVEIDSTQTYAKVEGKVQLAQDGLFSQSEQVNYNLQTQLGGLDHSYYISEEQQAYGYADKIERRSENVVVLENASFSTCEPSQKPAWHIKAKSLEINQNTGRGVTKDAKFYIKDVPVIPVPYFNFPIDDRRTTGFLTPSFGYTNDGGVQLTVPYYLNLAPNYDLTATPRYINNRGLMLEGDIGYLTQNFGRGDIWGGYLPEDEQYSGEDRKDLHWLHDWKINSQWQTGVNLNYVSDKDYFTDLGTSPTSQDSVNQERTWVLNYANGIPGITAQLRVQDFQTLDDSIKDVDRPYARLPQFLFYYEGGNFNGLEYSFSNDTAYFQKSINDDSALESSGTRIYNEASLAYNYRGSSSFIIPELTLRSINTFYDRDTKLKLGYNANDSVEKAVAIPQFTLDTGVIFEKTGKYLQSISPRVFYAYAPYKNQNDYPNFDSAVASISYDQLFNAYRFYGHDRLEDNNFASFGLTYRLYDKIGLERLRASIGQSHFFSDRKVRLNSSDPIATDKSLGPVITLSSQLSNNINIVGNTAWLSSGENALSNISANYADDQGRLYNLGYYYRRNVSDQGQQAYKQITSSFIQPINNKWRVLGHVQYDFNANLSREVLLGLNYESCCWGVSLYGRSYYNDLDDPTESGVSAKKAIMAEFSLKGLGGLSGKLTSLMKNRMIGFDHVNQTWTQR